MLYVCWQFCFSHYIITKQLNLAFSAFPTGLFFWCCLLFQNGHFVEQSSLSENCVCVCVVHQAIGTTKWKAIKMFQPKKWTSKQTNNPAHSDTQQKTVYELVEGTAFRLNCKPVTAAHKPYNCQFQITECFITINIYLSCCVVWCNNNNAHLRQLNADGSAECWCTRSNLFGACLLGLMSDSLRFDRCTGISNAKNEVHQCSAVCTVIKEWTIGQKCGPSSSKSTKHI